MGTTKGTSAPEGTTAEGDAVEEIDTRITIDDFCARKSETLRRPELLAAFAHTEQVLGTVLDTTAAFDGRLTAFINKPV